MQGGKFGPMSQLGSALEVRTMLILAVHMANETNCRRREQLDAMREKSLKSSDAFPPICICLDRCQLHSILILPQYELFPGFPINREANLPPGFFLDLAELRIRLSCQLKAQAFQVLRFGGPL